MVRDKFSVVWHYSIRFMQAVGRERNMVVCAASEKMFCDRRNLTGMAAINRSTST
jgi:hypothetical protein